MKLVVVALLALVVGTWAAVLDLTPDNFDKVIDGSKPAFVEVINTLPSFSTLNYVGEWAF